MVRRNKINFLNPFELLPFSMSEQKQKKKDLGLPPGTLVYVGPKRSGTTKITVIDYDKEHIEEREIKNIEDCKEYTTKRSVSWINVDGIEQVGIIEKIDDYFKIHPLVAEDILNTHQRPKVEDYDDYLFICLKMLMLDEKQHKVISEHVSLIVGKDYVLSFQEAVGDDVFDIIRERIRQGKGRVRSAGADYLAYALIDAIVDNYFVVLESISERIEALEQNIMSEKEGFVAQKIHLLKRSLIYLRKQVWPLREVINTLQKLEPKLITKDTQLYLRDAYDHIVQVIDTIELSRDITTGLHDVYLSTISNRLNEIMKVLTIFSAFFIPLTFIVGLYGMNFDYMPELHWKWGYFGILSVMAIIGTSMLVYFKVKRWI